MEESISDRVIQAIKKSELDDNEIAELIGVNTVTVWRWRTGETKTFDRNKLKLIANALHISYEWLRFGRFPKEKPPADQTRDTEVRYYVNMNELMIDQLEEAISLISRTLETLKQQ